MSDLNPSIINRIRAESNVGSPDIEHLHHRRFVPMHRQTETDSVDTGAELETAPTPVAWPKVMKERLGQVGNYLASKVDIRSRQDERSS